MSICLAIADHIRLCIAGLGEPDETEVEKLGHSIARLWCERVCAPALVYAPRSNSLHDVLGSECDHITFVPYPNHPGTSNVYPKLRKRGDEHLI